MEKCFFCDSPLIWGGDMDAEVIYGEDYAGRIWANYHCPKCGSEYEVVTPDTWRDCPTIKMEAMKTIKERAWEKYPEVIKHHNLATIDINEEKRKMYIEIATEQKAVDDAELAEVRKQRDAYYDELVEMRARRLEWTNKAVAWVDHNVGPLSAMALRKVMEE